MPKEILMALITAVIFGGFCLLFYLLDLKSLNIKSKTVGDGQHGTARFATHKEITRTFSHVPYTPSEWRKINPKHLPQGIVLGCNTLLNKVTALVDDSDVHALMIGAAGVGKTAKFLYPNLEYCCAAGMSFITTDTKGDLMRSYAPIAKKYYGYDISILDLRNPTQSDGFNMLHLVNKYMDSYLETGDISTKAKAEKYAKIIAKTIVYSGSFDAGAAGQNAFFYDAAEGLLTSVILLIAEYCSPMIANNEVDQRHIISVFKIIQDLQGPTKVKGVTQFKELIMKLPDDHKARWFSGAALNSSEQAMQSVLSTALSRLNAFLDSETEQILCFDTKINAENFCKTKSAVFLIMPEEDNSKYFLVSLIIQQLYREMLSVADEFGGKLPNRVMMWLDEYGTLPKIESAEMMFSASRSRKISIVAIIQSLAQLDKNYGKEGAEIIVDNCQLSIYGGFAPNSETANVLSKNLGEKTVMTGSVSKGRDKSQSLQMTGKSLMTPDQLKAMPKDTFIVSKTGTNPMRVFLRLFFKWGIELNETFQPPKSQVRKVAFADKVQIEEAIERLKQKTNGSTEEPSSAASYQAVDAKAEPPADSLMTEIGGNLKC